MSFAEQRALGADAQNEKEKGGVRFEPLLGSPCQALDDQAPIVGLLIILSFQGLLEGAPLPVRRLVH